MPNSLISIFRWVFFERGFQVALGLAGNIIIARYLGVSYFGIYQTALAISAIYASVGLFLSLESVAPFVHNKNINLIVPKIFWLRMCLAAFAFFMLFFSLPAENTSNLKPLVTFLGVTYFLSEPFAAYSMKLQFHGMQNRLSKIKIYALIAKLLTIVIIVKIRLGLLFFAIPIIVEWTFFATLIIFSQKSNWVNFFVTPTKYETKQLFRRGILFGFGLILMVAFQKADRIFMEHINGNVEVGLYSSVLQIFENWFFVGTMVAQAYAMRKIYPSEKSDHEVKKALFNLTKIFSIVAIFIYFMSLIFAKKFVIMMYGEDYVIASKYVVWLALISIPVFLDAAFTLHITRNALHTHFLIKWLLVLIYGVSYFLIAGIELSNYSPIVYLGGGYSIAFLYSFCLFVRNLR